jgi:nitrite reductase/ring-hydroxylating ferredoxin subunit
MVEPIAHETESEEQHLCAGRELVEHGCGKVFDVLAYRAPATAFAVRAGGVVVAYLNRCVHVPTELDWQRGEFFDADRRSIICAVHGATYEPGSGRCIGGPCGSGRLTRVRVQERDGEVYWYPSRDIRPLPAAGPPDDPPAPGRPAA